MNHDVWALLHKEMTIAIIEPPWRVDDLKLTTYSATGLREMADILHNGKAPGSEATFELSRNGTIVARGLRLLDTGILLRGSETSAAESLLFRYDTDRIAPDSIPYIH